MKQSILISDCLQQDFVGPIGRHDVLPNALHVGHEESLRLLGEDPAQGPVARVMAWAHQQPDSQLQVIHVRDWHNSHDPDQQSHLEQFGVHCVSGSPGAEFVFATNNAIEGKKLTIINATTLSNFIGADLDQVLQTIPGPARVGLMGVWTEAKITFLAYELRCRYPDHDLAVCSALTASSSRQNHFLALDQLERILGVRVVSSVGDFIAFLGGELDAVPLIGFSHKHPTVHLAEGTVLSQTDENLARYLFRGCRELTLTSLDGGFSGNQVLAASSIDMHGHVEAPHVLKIGERGPIGQERTSFERVESVLGNAAPRITDFADLGARGAIKYRYASMGRGTSQSFQKLYMNQASTADIEHVLDAVFTDQLGRFYRAAELESQNLLDYYQFSSKWAAGVQRKVTEIVGEAAKNDVLEFPGGRRVANVVRFYAREVDAFPRRHRAHYFSFVHGDLNGANMILDGQKNVWLIDFFHSHRGHVLKDLAKLENDILYIFTPIDSTQQLEQALQITDALLSIDDLGRPLTECPSSITDPGLQRAWQTVQKLRSYYPELIKADREPTQLLMAQIRYAVHTLGFNESSPLQRRWALYTACSAAAQLRRRLTQAASLRIDWLPLIPKSSGRLGLTWLPGRKDAARDVAEDVQRIVEENVGAVVCLLSHEEFARYGVESLCQAYQDAGLALHQLPILDGMVPNHREMQRTVQWIHQQQQQGRAVLVHCVGGLGRAGTVAACWLKSLGLSSESAIHQVRQTRSTRAIETVPQERFIDLFQPSA